MKEREVKKTWEFLIKAKLIILMACMLFVLSFSLASFTPSISSASTELNNHVLNCLKPLGYHLYPSEKICPWERIQNLVNIWICNQYHI